MIKIAHIIGARPQFIKCSPLLMACKKYNSQSTKKLQNIIIHTGQHYDYLMSEIFFKELGVTEPDFHLGVGSCSHGKQTGQILQKVEEVLIKVKPNACLVYGDTNSTLGGALASVKIHLPVIHVEAGLRSYNRFMPEEVNRVLTDHSSAMLLCPTENAVSNLKKEGFSKIVNRGRLIGKKLLSSKNVIDLNHPVVFNVGDVMYDVLLYTANIAEEQSKVLEKLGLENGNYAVLTIHRAENSGDSKKLSELLRFVTKSTSDLTVVFPVHPRTEKNLRVMKSKFAQRVRFVAPLGYFDMLKLVKNSSMVFTDSGGLQKEAFWLKIPCVTLRNETEWIETIQSGWNVLYRDYKKKHHLSNNCANDYGDGKAAEKIVNIIVNTIPGDKND